MLPSPRPCHGKILIFQWCEMANNLLTTLALKQALAKSQTYISELIAFKLQERDACQASLKYNRDLKDVNDTAYADGVKDGFEKGFEKGFEQGYEEGFKQGIEQGFEKGMEQGREEERAAAYQDRLNTARNLKQLGISNEQIAHASGLPLSVITNL